MSRPGGWCCEGNGMQANRADDAVEVLEVKARLRLPREVASDEVAAALPHAGARGGVAVEAAKGSDQRGGVLGGHENAGACGFHQPAGLAINPNDNGSRGGHELENLGWDDAPEQCPIAQ